MYLYNDEIIREGTIGRKMYFISKALFEFSPALPSLICWLMELFFGEISLILPHLRRVASVFADSYCYLYTLTVDDFNDTLNDFPLQRQHFISEAGKRLDNMKMDTDLEDESSEPTSVTATYQTNKCQKSRINYYFIINTAIYCWLHKYIYIHRYKVNDDCLLPKGRRIDF